MGKEIPEHIYLKNDIDRAFNMGLETGVALFEKTIGMSQESQRTILNRIKDMLIADKTESAMARS